MLETLSRGRRNAALAILGLLTLWFAWSLRSVVNPLLLGYLLAYVLHPIVQRLKGRRLSHRGAVNLTFALGGLLILLVGFGLVFETRRLVRDVIHDDETGQRIQLGVAELREDLEEWLPADLLPDQAEVKSLVQRARDLWTNEDTREAATGAAGMGLRATGGIWNAIRSFVGWLFGVGGLLVMVPIYTYYLLFELERLHEFVRRYLPKRERARISRIGSQIGEVLANFFRGRLTVCFLKGAVLTAGLAVVGVPYSLLLGMGSGFLSLIPALGPFLGFLGAFLLAAIEPDSTWLSALLRTGGVFVVAEVLEGYYLIPKVLGDTLGLHPVVVLFAVLAGGAALGLFGVLVALPLTASIVILVRELVLPALANFADEDEAGGDGVILVTGSETTTGEGQ